MDAIVLEMRQMHTRRYIPPADYQRTYEKLASSTAARQPSCWSGVEFDVNFLLEKRGICTIRRQVQTACSECSPGGVCDLEAEHLRPMKRTTMHYGLPE